MENPIDEVLKETREERERLEQLRKERESAPNYGGNNYHQEVQSINGVPGVIALISLFGGFLGLLIFAKTEPRIAVACVGQIFLVMGLVVLFSQKLTLDNLPVLVFPLAGAAMVFFPLDSLYRSKHDLPPLLSTNGVGILAASVFLIVGLCLIFVPVIKRSIMLKRCTMTVQATCIGLDSKLSSSSSSHGRRHYRTRVYAPDWEYTVNGKIYNHLESTYTNTGYPEIGSVHEIYVDPNDPLVIYRKSTNSLIVTVIGIAFTGVSLLVLYMMLFAK